jgi:membrane associated rhomboid family serine protease
MFFDLLLLSVIAVTLYLGPLLLHRGEGERRTYAWMLLANLALALVAFAGRKGDGDSSLADTLGFVAIAAGVFLVMVPVLVRDLAFRAYRADRLRLAARLVALRELLQPGMGAAQERELIESMIDVREGRIDRAIASLRVRRTEIEDPIVRRRIDERVVMTLLYARRWDEAIDAYESTVVSAIAPASPQTMAEMVWAYCEAGEMEKAAELVESLEASPLATEPLFTPLLARARLVFLAFVGRTQAVEAIVGPSGSLGGIMSDAVRLFWAGVARLYAGDRPGARRSLGEAAERSGRNQRVRDLAEHRLTLVDEPGVAGPHAFPASVAELADRLAAVAAEPVPVATRLRGQRLARRGVPVTIALIGANVAVSIGTWVVYGSTDSIGALVRGGNLRAGVEVGEWWRLASSMFLHAGLLHLFLNMYGVWVLGKFVEQIVGSLRFFAIYIVAGLVGAFASNLVNGAGVSVGASGAVLGLAGALLAELGLHREAYPKRWRQGLFRVLLFLTAANVAIGFAYPAIDQAAHIGGLVAGASLAAGLSPWLGVAEAVWVRTAARGLAVACAAAIAWGAYGAVTTDYAETLAKSPPRHAELDGLTVTVPGTWLSEDGFTHDPYGLILVRLRAEAGASARALLDAEAERLQDPPLRTELLGLDRLRPLGEGELALPAPWWGVALRGTEVAPGMEAVFSVIALARPAPDGRGAWVGFARIRDGVSGELMPVLSAVLESARVGVTSGN